MQERISERSKYGTGLTIGVPIGGSVAGEFFIHFQSMLKQMPRGITFNTVHVLRQPVDAARNIIVENAIEHKSKYVVMIDDDTLPPFFGIRRMIDLADNHNYDAIVGPSWPKAAFTRPTIYDSVETPGLTDWNYGDVFEVYLAGFPFVLLRVSALVMMKDYLIKTYTKTPRKWFYSGEWFANRDGFKEQRYEGAEDFHFWYHWHECNLRVVCDTWCASDHVDRSNGRLFPTPDVVDGLLNEGHKGKRFFQVGFPMDASKEGVQLHKPPVFDELPVCVEKLKTVDAANVIPITEEIEKDESKENDGSGEGVSEAKIEAGV